MAFFNKKQKEPQDISQLLVAFNQLIKNQEEMEKRIKQLEEKALQKCSTIRFNPFNDTGGDQSFSTVLLDGCNDGVVFTGLYARDDSRFYAKPIKNGTSSYRLSDSEEKVIQEAKKKNV